MTLPREIRSAADFGSLEAGQTIRLGLERMRRLCEKLDHPERAFRAVHVAGTNGKGSICAAIHAVLAGAGAEPGLYTSPHLVSPLERVRIGRRDWTETELVSSVNEALSAVHGDTALSAEPPTVFELVTAAAFLALARAGVKLAVIEVGLGGRLDSTTVCHPEVCVISSIGLDHQQYLGPDILSIGREKAGIIREKAPVVTSAVQPEIQRLIHDTAMERLSPCYLGGRHFDYVSAGRDVGIEARFDYLGINTRWPDLPLPLPGAHQFQNMAAACAALELLAARGVAGLAPETVRSGLASVRWPGRLEHVSTSPDLWLDGAHNPDAARVLAKFLETAAAGRRLHFIVGFRADKQQREFLEIIAPLAHRITATGAPGLMPADEAGRIAAAVHRNTVVEPELAKILAQLHWRKDATETAVVTGSLYLVGAAKAWLDLNMPGQRSPAA